MRGTVIDRLCQPGCLRNTWSGLHLSKVSIRDVEDVRDVNIAENGCQRQCCLCLTASSVCLWQIQPESALSKGSCVLLYLPVRLVHASYNSHCMPQPAIRADLIRSQAVSTMLTVVQKTKEPNSSPSVLAGVLSDVIPTIMFSPACMEEMRCGRSAKAQSVRHLLTATHSVDL